MEGPLMGATRSAGADLASRSARLKGKFSERLSGAGVLLGSGGGSAGGAGADPLAGFAA